MKKIYLIAPGGATAVGGMARLIDYVTRAWSSQAYGQAYGMELVVVDNTGPYIKWKMPFYFAAAMLRVLGAGLLRRIDLLHIHMAERGSVLRKLLILHLGRALGIPVILHLHGANFAEFCDGLPAWLRRVVIASMNRANAVVVLGSHWASYVERIGIDPGRIRIIRNAVPGPEASSAARPGGRCRILFLGVIAERKGMPELIEALSREELRGLDWEIAIGGNGNTDPYLALVEQHGLSDRVRFLGWVDNPKARALLAETDIFVLPSRNEGLPMAILEAMAFGVPVVATPVGDIREAVEDGVTGVIVPVRDPQALAKALADLVRDPVLRRRLGDQALTRFHADFDIAAFNRRLAALYAETMAAHPSMAIQAPAGTE